MCWRLRACRSVAVWRWVLNSRQRFEFVKGDGLKGWFMPNIYGVLPVLEALRAGGRRIERIVIAAGAKHERLREVNEAVGKPECQSDASREPCWIG